MLARHLQHDSLHESYIALRVSAMDDSFSISRPFDLALLIAFKPLTLLALDVSFSREREIKEEQIRRRSGVSNFLPTGIRDQWRHMEIELEI